MPRSKTAGGIAAGREYQRKWRREWSAKNPGRASATYKRYYDATVETRRKKAREWYHANKTRGKANARASYIRNKYGLTRDEYAALSRSCAICGATEMVTKTGRRYALHVDHCHDTDKVRGMLCHHCNTGIGNMKHDVVLLEKAIAYLRKA